MDGFKQRISDYTSRLLFQDRKHHDSTRTRHTQTRGSLSASSKSLVSHADSEGAGSHLPIELLFKIFVELPRLVDILKCRGVCKRFQHIIDETPEIQYAIELHVSGYKNNDENTFMGASARLRALKEHQQWWKAPRGNTWHRKDLDWVHQSFMHNQYYDNVWVRCDRDLARMDSSDCTRWNTIHCVCFEQAEDGTPIVDQWTLSVPFVYESFTADPARNELYLVNSTNIASLNLKCFRLWTLSLSDGIILSDQTFESEAPVDERRLSQTMYCQENVTAIMTYVITEHMNSVKVHIVLLDRLSGTIIDSFPRVIPGDAQLSFHLICKDRFLFHLMEGGKFITEVYVVAPLTTTQPPRIQLASTFHYPEARQSYVLAVGHNSFSVGRSRWGLMSRNAPPRPFSKQPNGTQLLFILRIYGITGLTRILHCIPMSVFTSAVDAFNPSIKPAQPLSMPWESWGPRNTRCFIDNDAAMPGSYGYQVLRPNFTLLDFNPVGISRDLHRVGIKAPATDVSLSRSLSRRGKSLHLLRGDKPAPASESQDDVDIPGCTGRIILQPTVIRREALFSQDIVTTLPYRETKLNWTGPSPEHVFGGETWVACTRDVEAVHRRQEFHVLQVHS